MLITDFEILGGADSCADLGVRVVGSCDDAASATEVCSTGPVDTDRLRAVRHRGWRRRARKRRHR